MKIALLGNMNNNNYVLLRYLRDNNLEADLLLFDDELYHFSPSHDSFSHQSFKHIKQLSNEEKFHYFKKWQTIIEIY